MNTTTPSVVTAKALGLVTIVTPTGTKKLAAFVGPKGERYTARPVPGLKRDKEVTLLSNTVDYPAAKGKPARTAVYWEVVEDFSDAVEAHDDIPTEDFPG